MSSEHAPTAPQKQKHVLAIASAGGHWMQLMQLRPAFAHHRVSYLTTLAGYIHWRLTGQKVLGVDEASGMFPIDSQTNDYDEHMIRLFNERLKTENISWKLWRTTRD